MHPSVDDIWLAEWLRWLNHLPSKHEALSSIPVLKRKEKKKEVDMWQNILLFKCMCIVF
jgi:hypothetical protein